MVTMSPLLSRIIPLGGINRSGEMDIFPLIESLPPFNPFETDFSFSVKTDILTPVSFTTSKIIFCPRPPRYFPIPAEFGMSDFS